MSTQGEFITNVTSTYSVGLDGVTTVSSVVSLENVYSQLYAVNYTMIVDGLSLYDIKASQDGKPLKTDIQKVDKKVTVKVFFEDQVVGLGKRRIFNISYKDKSIAVKTGEIWEILIPRIDSSVFDSYSVGLIVPSTLGEVAYISPSPRATDIQAGQNIFYFEKDVVAKSGVSAAFGKFQVFSFDLTYHLENPLAKTSEVEIAIPADTALQKVNYQSIDPVPKSVRIDEDGNWLALFSLKPRQRLDVKAKGAVQIFAEARNLPNENQDLGKYLKATEVWQVGDPKILSLANKLKTPRAIYDFVVSTLSYDYDRVQPNVSRLGAKEALENPSTAICMEFTDTFIALARAAGIPAREVNGFAYTENPQIQPLSLVADVLHAWPEYWDADKKTWIAVDPTWGSTSGVDFFSKLDLRHFAFVTHGLDSFKPYPAGSYKLGANPQKDVFVSFGGLPEKRTSTSEIMARETGGMFFTPLSFNITLSNKGPVALYNQTLIVEAEGTQARQFQISSLPPYSSEVFKFSPKYGFMGKDLPEVISLTTAGNGTSVPTHKINIIISNLAIILSLILVVVFVLYIKLKNIYEKRRALKKNSIKST